MFLSGEDVLSECHKLECSKTMCGFKTEVKKQQQTNLKDEVMGQSHKGIMRFCFQSRLIKLLRMDQNGRLVHAEAIIHHHPMLLVFFLAPSAAPLIVDHREQNPKVQKSYDDKPHQNWDEEISINIQVL